MFINLRFLLNYIALLVFGTRPAPRKRIVRQTNCRRPHYDEYKCEDESSYESHFVKSPVFLSDYEKAMLNGLRYMRPPIDTGTKRRSNVVFRQAADTGAGTGEPSAHPRESRRILDSDARRNLASSWYSTLLLDSRFLARHDQCKMFSFNSRSFLYCRKDFFCCRPIEDMLPGAISAAIASRTENKAEDNPGLSCAILFALPALVGVSR